MKRAFDLTFAVLILLPAVLIVATAAIFVRLESPGSPLFFQTRVGRKKIPFQIVKLRTMSHGTGLGASHEIGSANITKVGRFLRRTKIDELPQLWSVLRGEMSFVGPRPCLPQQGELIAERDRHGVFQVRPGITGRAQIMGIDMSRPAILAKVDGEYVRKRSLLEDVRILIHTLAGRGYYDAADVLGGHKDDWPPPR